MIERVVPYVPGRYDKQLLRSVTEIGQNDVTRQYGRPDRRASTRHRLQRVKVAWARAGLPAVIAILAACLIADGTVLFLIAGWA